MWVVVSPLRWGPGVTACLVSPLAFYPSVTPHAPRDRTQVSSKGPMLRSRPWMPCGVRPVTEYSVVDTHMRAEFWYQRGAVSTRRGKADGRKIVFN